MTSPPRRRRPLAIAIASLLAACGPGEPSPDGALPTSDASTIADGGSDGGGCAPVEAWSPSAAVVVPDMALTLEAETALDPTMIEVRFDGGEPVAFTALDARSLGLLTPALSPGEHTLEVRACGGTWSSALMFEAAPAVSAPAEVIAEISATLSGRLDALEADPDVAPAAVRGLRSLLAQAQTDFEAMSEDDQRALAATLAANRSLFDPAAAMCEAEGCDERIRCLRGRTIAFLTRLLLLGALVFVVPPPANLIPLVGVGIVLGEFASENSRGVYEGCLQALEQGLGVGEPLSGAGGGMTPLGPRSTELGLMYSGAPYALVVSAEYAALGGVDTGGHAEVSALASAAERIAAFWARVASAIEALGESLGFPVPVPRSTTSFDAVDLSLVEVRLDSPPAGLSLSTDDAGDGTMTFTFTYASEEPAEVDVIFAYDNAGVRTFEQRFAVVVSAPRCGDGGAPCCADGVCNAPYACGPDHYCQLGEAGDSCESHDDCSEGRCGPGGACGGFLATCTADEHCFTSPPHPDAWPERCGPFGYCVEMRCFSDSDCELGQECVAGPFFSQCQTMEGGIPCTSSDECPADTICGSDGLCRRPGGGGDLCGNSADCSTAAWECLNGYCTDTNEGSCGSCAIAGEVCHPEIRVCRPTCSSSGDCPWGVCGVSGVCGGDVGTSCGSGAHCTSGLCVEDVCAPEAYGRCVSDSDCGPASPRCNPDGQCQVGFWGERCDGDADCDASILEGGCNNLPLRCGPTGRCQSGRAWNPCTSVSHCAAVYDGDCELVGGPMCVRGACSEGAPLQPCDTDAQCVITGRCGPLGYCQDGSDGEPCADHSDCYNLCGPDGVCRRGNTGARCSDDDQCEAPLLCGIDHCQTGATGDPCAGDEDCRFSTICWFGRCAAP